MKSHVFIESTSVNPWERFHVRIDGVDSICWIYDPWRFSSFSTRVKSVLKSQDAGFDRIVDQLKSVSRKTNTEFTLVVRSGERLAAITDHIRGEPLYYMVRDEEILLSNTPNKLLEHYYHPTLTLRELREFALLNYTTDASTMLYGLFQLTAGELLQWNSGELEIDSYYNFWHYEPLEFSPEHASSEFREILLSVVSECLEVYPDHRIVLMLSGGLDSRLILWSLASLGAQNVLLCSYGRWFQRDVHWAKRFAGLTGFPWEFIPLNYRTIRRIFQSPERCEYSRHYHYFSRVPFLQDYPAIEYLRRRRSINGPTLFITGNTGDFISGGHMPSSVRRTLTLEETVEAILNKHYSCWSRDYLTPAVHESIRAKVRGALGDAPAEGRSGDNLFEWWEWRERQSKFVVGSKKLYQWHGFPLFLPLWDKRVMEFFRRVPFQFRQDQRFYRQFCQSLRITEGSPFSGVPATEPGKNVPAARKFRRAVEYVANANWGRYSASDLDHILRSVSYLLGGVKPVGFPSVNVPYNGTILWNLLQSYPIMYDEKSGDVPT